MRQILVAICLTIFFVGCITPGEKKVMKSDIFSLQTRLLQVEQATEVRSKEAQETGKSANQRIASTYSDIEKMKKDMREVRGTLDALRMGVITGQMPGAAAAEGSVATTLTQLADRLDAIEETQKEIVASVKKAGLKTVKKSRKPAGSVSALQKQFDSKKYKDVIDDAVKLLKEASAEDRQKVGFLQAEALYKIGRMRDAALKFNDLIESSPEADRMRHAKMRMGDCFKNLGDKETAKIYYEEVIAQYPDSDEASKSKARMADLG